MKRTPLLNTKLVQHMDVPTIPNVLMLDAGESLEDQTFVRGDLLDAESIDIYFKNTQYKLLNVFDVVTAKLRNHISDTFCHTNPIEKRYWNNKVDTSRYEAAMSIVQERLHALEEIIKGVPGEGVDFSSFITYDKLIDILSNRNAWPLEIDGYVKEGGKLGTINGVDFYQGASITIGPIDPDDPDAPSTSKSYKVTGLSYNNGQITLSQENNPNSPYTINVPTSEVDQTTINNIINQVANSISYTANITSSTADSYKIGTLNVGTNNHFDLYGKDTYGSGGGPNPYTLPAASRDELGGIKLGYPQNGKNYPVQLDGFSQAFVNVPWGDVESATGYWELIFKAVYGESAPSLPSNFDNNPDGWSHSAENNDGSKTVWMANRWVNGAGVAGSWNGPWRISGKNGVDGQDGENGVDGTEYEYIYKTTTTQDAPSLASEAVQTDDYFPTGWNDNPSGVDQTNRYEWMAFRTKTFSTSDPTGTWSLFYGPVLWSSYGRNGTDGDGVEYIFYMDLSGTNSPRSINEDNWPPSWTRDDDFQTQREYIRDGSDWTDDPQNHTQQGSRQYVSVRKRYADNDGEQAYWHEYSTPTLWSYYSKDGGDNGYDDSGIRNQIETLTSDLDKLAQSIDDTVATEVSERLSHAEWLRLNFPWGEIFNYSGWDEGINGYLQEVGLVDNNGNVGWSTLLLTVSSINSEVTNLKNKINGGQSMTGTQIVQAIDADKNNAWTNMYSFYTDLDDNGNILKELVAGFKSEANQNATQAAQYARAVGENSNGIAGVITRVDTLEGDVTNVRAELGSKWSQNDVENYFTTAGVITTANADGALALIFAQDKTESDAVAAILLKVEGDESIITIDSLETRITGYLSAGNATFKGDVNATTFRAGSTESANMVINGDSIDFYFGNERRAYFTQGDNNSGMQLYILKDDASWYKLDFENLSSASGNWGVSVYKRLLKSNNTMEEHRLYYNPTDNCYYTGPSTSSSKANGNYFIETPGWYSDSTGEGECLYGVVSDTSGTTVVGAYVKDAQQYTLVNFENGVKHETSNFVYTGYAPNWLSIKGSGDNPYDPSIIGYSDTATILVPNGLNVEVNWISNGYENEPYNVDKTINTPVKNGTFDQLNGEYPEYETQDISRYAGAPGMITPETPIEDDDLYY